MDVVVLQETWMVKHPELYNIVGYQGPILKTRQNNNGGGVGFYIRNGIKYKDISTKNSFREKIFESATLEIQFGKTPIIISSMYRPPITLPNQTSSEQFDIFNNCLADLLTLCNTQNKKTYIFSDSNLNLHKINNDAKTNEYLNTILGNGFIQLITKSTRIQNKSYSLIDHIITNNVQTKENYGIIISDISDHFFTFNQLNLTVDEKKTKHIQKRNMSSENIQRFKDNLRNISWREVLDENGVDEAFSIFWEIFKPLYDLHFPLTKSKFNKNIHKKTHL